MTNTKKVWKPSEVQEKFLNALTSEPMTLAEVSAKAGVDFKSGSINVLVTNGLVAHGDDKEVTVSVKRKVKTYKLGGKSE
jgi:hypothetical protein